MTTIKSYTDKEQSKKLAKILPIESADMFWYRDAVVKEANPRIMNYMQIPELQSMYYYPCWSLASLLEEIPSTIVNNVDEDLKLHIYKDNLQYYLSYENEYTGDMFEIETELYENMIDACYEMIIRLNELKLLQL
jgi:hypothetical protein